MTPAGGICQDILTISTNTGQAIPEICGMNTGQHGTYNAQCAPGVFNLDQKVQSRNLFF